MHCRPHIFIDLIDTRWVLWSLSHQQPSLPRNFFLVPNLEAKVNFSNLPWCEVRHMSIGPTTPAQLPLPICNCMFYYYCIKSIIINILYSANLVWSVKSTNCVIRNSLTSCWLNESLFSQLWFYSTYLAFMFMVISLRCQLEGSYSRYVCVYLFFFLMLAKNKYLSFHKSGLELWLV